MKKYSPSTYGFYDTEIHKTLPDDCLDLTDAEYLALIEGQSQLNKEIKYNTVTSKVEVVDKAPVQYTYAQLRSSEYPPMADYLDAVVKGDQVAIQAYIDACLAVKAKYPKPL